MDLFTFQYTQADAWSVDKFPPVDSEQTLLLVFGSRSLMEDGAALAELRQHYPRSKIIGCSTAGEIFDDRIFDDSLSVALLRFKKTRLKFVCTDVDESTDLEAAARKLADELLQDDLAAVMLFNDGLHVNGSAIMRGLKQVLPSSIPVTGGMAADGERFENTWVLCDGKPRENHIVLLGLYGDSLCFQYGSKGGWDIFGPERVVTRSEGNVLYELDGKPALSLYKDYLGEMAADLPASGVLYPLLSREGDHEVVRTIVAVNEADASLTLAGDIPQGAKTRLMHANFDRLITGASDAAGEIHFDCCNLDGAVLAVAISCFGRRKVLKDRTEEEVDAVHDALPDYAKVIGFYSYGEFSPISSGACELHNQTMTITLISERSES